MGNVLVRVQRKMNELFLSKLGVALLRGSRVLNFISRADDVQRSVALSTPLKDLVDSSDHLRTMSTPTDS